MFQLFDLLLISISDGKLKGLFGTLPNVPPRKKAKVATPSKKAQAAKPAAAADDSLQDQLFEEDLDADDGNAVCHFLC